MPHLKHNATLQDLTLFNACLDIQQASTEISECFAMNPSLPGIVLLSQTHLHNLLSRSLFMEIMSQPYSNDLFSRRKVESLLKYIKHAPLCIPANTIISTAVQLCLQRPAGQIQEPIVVLEEDGSCAGVLDMQQLLLAHVKIYAHTVNLLEHREQELHALFNAMSDDVLLLNAQGYYRMIGLARPHILHHQFPDLIGKRLQEILSAEEAERFLKYIQRCLTRQKNLTFEYRLRRLGQNNWFAVSLSPLCQDWVVMVAHDITRRRRMEASLRLSEEKFSKAFRASPDAIMLSCLESGVFLDVNHSFEEIFGYQARAVIGKSSLDVGLWLNAEDRVAMLNALHRDGEVQNMEFQFATAGGEQRDVEFSAELITLQGENYLLAVVHDITRRKRTLQALEEAQAKSERLLLNILPSSIAEKLKNSDAAIAQYHPAATILFSDIVGFTPLSAQLTPIELVNLLNRIFSIFDQLAEKHGLEKIKTIGDAYMVVGGLPEPQDNHIAAVANFALEMQQAIKAFADCDPPLQIRIGINTGAVVAGVIGRKKFSYDLWGDTVNTASRMESSGETGKIQVTEAVYTALKHSHRLSERGMITIKGKGQMRTFWLIDSQFPTSLTTIALDDRPHGVV